jgi:hypothetical protein
MTDRMERLIWIADGLIVAGAIILLFWLWLG